MSAPIGQLLSEFIDAWNAGARPRVDDYLQRAAPGERDELADRLEAWLLVAPSPAYDVQALGAIRAEPAYVGALAEIDAAGLWPEVLPRLRERAGVKIRELAGRITATFGLTGEEPRTERYLERLEAGDLDVSRVSRRLLDALGTALGVSAADLLRAGGVRPAAAPPGQALFRAERYAAASFEEDLEALSRAALTPAPEPMDELDRLFVGGRDA